MMSESAVDPRVHAVRLWSARRRARILKGILLCVLAAFAALPWPIGSFVRRLLGWVPAFPGSDDAGTAATSFLLGTAIVGLLTSVILLLIAVVSKRYLLLVASALLVAVSPVAYSAAESRVTTEFTSAMSRGLCDQLYQPVTGHGDGRVLVGLSGDVVAGCSGVVKWRGHEILDSQKFPQTLSDFRLGGLTTGSSGNEFVFAYYDPVILSRQTGNGKLLIWNMAGKSGKVLDIAVPTSATFSGGKGRTNFMPEAVGQRIVYGTTVKGQGVVRSIDVESGRVAWTAGCPSGERYLHWIKNSLEMIGSGPAKPSITCISGSDVLKVYLLDVTSGRRGQIVEERKW